MILTAHSIVLLFIYCETIDAEDCRTDVPPLTNFDPKRYFSGKWYLTAASMIVSDLSDICEESTNDVLPNGMITERTVHYLAPIEKFTESMSISNIDNFRDGLANYSIKMSFIEPDIPKMTYQFAETILYTDYDRYTVLYSCINNIDNRNSGKYYVYKRDINDESVDKYIENIFRKENIDYSKFIFRRDANCKQCPYF